MIDDTGCFQFLRERLQNEGLLDTCAKGADLGLDFPSPFDAAVDWPVEAGQKRHGWRF